MGGANVSALCFRIFEQEYVSHAQIIQVNKLALPNDRVMSFIPCIVFSEKIMLNSIEELMYYILKEEKAMAVASTGDR